MIILTRFAYSDFGTFGRLSAAGRGWHTVERPWADNARNVSCIPEGVYTVRRDYYHRGGYEAFEIENVPDRSEIKIHIGNTMDDVSGCIAVGMDLGWVHGKWAVIHSKVAFHDFMNAMKNIDKTCIKIMQYRPEVTV